MQANDIVSENPQSTVVAQYERTPLVPRLTKARRSWSRE